MTVVQKFAQWAWTSNNRDVTPEICLSSLSNPCITALLVKGVGLAVICGAFLNKAPLISNILINQSVAGISSGSVYGEIIMYSNSALYSILSHNPFTAWGENGVLTVQTLFVCTLLWKYKENPKVALSERYTAIVVYGFYLGFVFLILSPSYYYLLMTANWPVLIFSRGSQILTFMQCKHTGTQSLITTLMNLLGSAIRIITTVKEIGFDLTLLGGYGISVLLNLTLVLQFIIYKENTKIYINERKTK